MDSSTTHELVLTRLWYLVGDWEGMGKGPDFRFRANARYSWIFNDHFLVGHMEVKDFGSGTVLSIEDSHIYHDPELNCLVGDIFNLDGSVEHALGHVDARGRMMLTTDRLSCLPRGTSIRRLRRTVWTMATAQWAFTVEMDSGQGFGPYYEGQMRRV